MIFVKFPEFMSEHHKTLNSKYLKKIKTIIQNAFFQLLIAIKLITGFFRYKVRRLWKLRAAIEKHHFGGLGIFFKHCA